MSTLTKVLSWVYVLADSSTQILMVLSLDAVTTPNSQERQPRICEIYSKSAYRGQSRSPRQHSHVFLVAPQLREQMELRFRHGASFRKCLLVAVPTWAWDSLSPRRLYEFVKKRKAPAPALVLSIATMNRIYMATSLTLSCRISLKRRRFHFMPVTGGYTLSTEHKYKQAANKTCDCIEGVLRHISEPTPYLRSPHRTAAFTPRAHVPAGVLALSSLRLDSRVLRESSPAPPSSAR